MTRWKLWMLAAGLTMSAGVAVAQSPADAVVQQLREQGYVEVEVTRTLLGRIRVLALASDGSQREIVFIPATGEILRDYSEAADGGVAPQILDRPANGSRPQAAPSSPTSGNSADDHPQPDRPANGNRGRGNDGGGPDDNGPGRAQESHGGPGGGPNGNSPSHGGGNGAKD